MSDLGRKGIVRVDVSLPLTRPVMHYVILRDRSPASVRGIRELYPQLIICLFLTCAAEDVLDYSEFLSDYRLYVLWVGEVTVEQMGRIQETFLTAYLGLDGLVKFTRDLELEGTL